MALDPPWTWPKFTFCNLVFCCFPTCTLLLEPSFQGLAQPTMKLYVLLTFVHAVPATWNVCPTPSSPPGEPPWILYNADYVSFSFMPSFNKYVLICQAQDTGGLKTDSALSPHGIIVTLVWNTQFLSPCLYSVPVGVCVCVCVYMYVPVHTYVYVWSCVFLYVCVHTHMHTYLLQHRLHWILMVRWWILLFH